MPHAYPPLCVLPPAEKLSPERVKLVMEHIWRMQEFCNGMSKLSPDAYEYAYLKAIVLFSPGEYCVSGSVSLSVSLSLCPVAD